MSSDRYTPFNAMVDIIAAPGKALDNVKDHPAWLWWPLLTSIALTCIAFAWYYTWVDFNWLVDETINAIPAENRAQAADRIRSFMSPTTSIAMTVLSVVVITFLIYAVQAAYLHLAAKLTTDTQLRYGQWFAFSAWTAFVGIFGALAIMVVILMADSNQLSQTELAPLSMNALFIHARMGDPWFRWGSSLSLINIWMLVLMSIGFARWTGSSLAKSTIIAVLPWALIFGIWAALI